MIFVAEATHYHGDEKVVRKTLLLQAKRGLLAPVRVRLGRFYLDEDAPAVEARSA